MASINFTLNHQKKDSKGLIPVWMVLNFNGIRIRKATKAKLKEKYWAEKTQRIKPPLKGESYNNHAEFNTILDSTEKKVQDIFNHALLNGIPLTKEYVESQLNNKFSAQPKAKDFFTCFEEFIEANKPLKAKRTIMGYVTTVNFLKGFQNDSNLPIRFDTISLDWFDKLRAYAFKEKQVKDNYFSTLINRLKAFLGWAADRGYNENQAYKKFSTIEREGDIICLYEKELFQLYESEFNSKRLDQVRDVYCFGCFTGLRFSDLFDLGREHIKNGEIQKTIVKTRQFQKIPLNDFALAILNK
ncbi:integrase [Adhaeribacter arboris]|uniref:Integrase n=1 Tax=Adhaeribacter arboris TaxID=2072846 RepID=A0A2T2YJS9_9BACT|nr:phage integrase SAM-like domain-containing protein [Adhaeribacter arboris]PSR55761.1 integrase [Adhaeribacter arboris]